MPSATLLIQSLLSGLFTGALYALMGLGIGLTWGYLKLINLAQFALIFLGAYLFYQVTGVLGLHSNAHGPNEFLHVPTGKKVTQVIAHVLTDHCAQSAG